MEEVFEMNMLLLLSDNREDPPLVVELDEIRLLFCIDICVGSNEGMIPSSSMSA